MNENNTFWIGLFVFLSILTLTTNIMISSVGMPRDFTFTINHNADNNTKALYDALGNNIDGTYNHNSTSCIVGCERMFDEFANTPNAISIDGFYKKDCIGLCSE